MIEIEKTKFQHKKKIRINIILYYIFFIYNFYLFLL